MTLLLKKQVTAINQVAKEKNMNGYYRRRPELSFEEIRPLGINEIEFVSDVGEINEGDSAYECHICGEEVIGDGNENYCEQCCENSIEN